MYLGSTDSIFNHPQFDAEPQPAELRMSEDEMHKELEYIAYYRKLSEWDQGKFRMRVRKFVANTIIVGVRNAYLPDNMRAFIAASAVQLTFGLDDWMLDHFHTIRVYPKEFYSRVNERYLKGGAGGNGVIWFSWKDYLAGYADQENGINLGLHEMGHALMINMQQGEQDHRFVDAYDRLTEIEKQVIPLVRSGQVTFLRKYAATNTSEFFAVSMEHFFEQPAEFKKTLPVLYAAISELLQQDPAGERATGIEKRSTPLEPVLLSYDEKKSTEQKPRKNFRFANWHWSLSVLLMGIFISPWVLLIVTPMTFVSGGFLWLLYFCFVAGGGIYFYKRLVPTQALNLVQFVSFLLLGIGPLTLGATLLVNRVAPVHEEAEVYTLNGAFTYVRGGAAVSLVNGEYRSDPEVRTVSIGQLGLIRPGKKVKIIFKRGLLGMRYYVGTEIVE